MLIFYGEGRRKGTPVKLSCSCGDCQSSNTLSAIPIYKYAHIFWIPFFYSGREYIIHCSSCGMSHVKATINENISKDLKPPLWMFSGLIAIALFLAYLFWDNKTAPERNKKQALEYVAEPRVGDKYEIKIGEKEFSVCIVNRVVGDSIYLLEHQYSVTDTHDISGLSEGSYKDNYDSIPEGYTKEELRKVIEAGTILKINR